MADFLYGLAIIKKAHKESFFLIFENATKWHVARVENHYTYFN